MRSLPLAVSSQSGASVPQALGSATRLGALGDPQRGSGPARRTTVPLPNVENRLVIEGSRFVLYRAPEGLVYLRTTPDGVRTFLRKIDDQEMVLVSGGISRRGTGTEPPHGPEHLVEISAFLIDRREVPPSSTRGSSGPREAGWTSPASPARPNPPSAHVVVYKLLFLKNN